MVVDTVKDLTQRICYIYITTTKENKKKIAASFSTDIQKFLWTVKKIEKWQMYDVFALWSNIWPTKMARRGEKYLLFFSWRTTFLQLHHACLNLFQVSFFSPSM